MDSSCLRLILCLGVVVAGSWAHDDGDLQALFNKVSDNSGEIRRLYDKLDTDIAFAMAGLRSELKRHLAEKVGEVLSEILQEESIDEMIRSKVVSDVRQLRHNQHQIKTRLHHVTKSLNDVVQERVLYRESLAKAERNELLSCSKYIVDSRVLQRDLDEAESRLSQALDENRVLKESLQALNTSVQEARLADACNTTSSSTVFTDTSTELTTSTSVTDAGIVMELLTSTSMTSSTPTVNKTEAVRIRILLKGFTTSPKEFYLLDIDSNVITRYPYHKLEYVTALAFVPSTRRLLIATLSPDKIMSSPFDVSGRTVMREGVRCYGMAVDDAEGVVFLTILVLM